MRSKLLTIILSILIFSCQQEEGFRIYEEGEFYKLFGAGAREESVDIDIDSENGIFILATTNSFSIDTTEILLLKLDENGNEMFARLYNKGDHLQATDLLLNETSGEIFVLGNQLNDGVSSHVLIKTNLEGDTIWTKAYSGSGNTISCEAVLNSNDILICGEYKEEGSGSQYFVHRIDANTGDPVESIKVHGWKSENPQLDYDDKLVTVFPLENGDFMTFGNTGKPEPTQFKEGANVFFGPTPDFLGNNPYLTFGTMKDDSLFTVSKISDDEYLLAGGYFGDTTFAYLANLRFINNSPINTTIYQESDSTISSYTVSVDYTDQYYFLLNNINRGLADDNDIQLVQVFRTPDREIRKYNFGGDEMDRGVAIKVYQNHLYILNTIDLTNGNTMINLIKRKI